jgi:ABC-2 type transport system permease protein
MLLHTLMAAYHIAARELLSQLRSRSFLVQTLLLPLLLTGVLGLALGNDDRHKPTPMALAGEDTMLKRGFIEVMTRSKAVSVRESSSAEAADLVRQGQVVAALLLPDAQTLRRLMAVRSASNTASNTTSNTTSNSVQLLADPSSRVGKVIVEQISRAYLGGVEAGRAAILGALQSEIAANPAMDIAKAAATLQQQVSKDLATPSVSLDYRTTRDHISGYLAYFSIAFGVMFTVVTATQSAGSVLHEIERGTIVRLQAAPIHPSAMVAGKFIALLLVCGLQLGLFVLLTRLLFGVVWGPVAPVLLLVLVVALAAAGIGGLVIGLASASEQIGVYTLVFGVVMGLLGGSMYPVENLSGPAAFFSYFTVNRWAISAFQAVAIPQLGLQQAGFSLLVLGAIGLFGLVFGIWRVNSRIRRSVQ